jgi:hypothetical protein
MLQRKRDAIGKTLPRGYRRDRERNCAIVPARKYFVNLNNSMWAAHGTAALRLVAAMQQKRQSVSVQEQHSPPTQEQVMIPLVPAVRQTRGERFSALMQDMLRAWIEHHQRLADLGASRFL